MMKYDAVIIGSGQAGSPLAAKLAKAGWKTALIERRWLGGTCVNDGCTPSKTLIASGRRAYLARHSATLGVQVSPPIVDMATVTQRKDRIVTAKRARLEEWLRQTNGLDIITGSATFIGDKKLTVHHPDGTSTEVEGNFIFINTGTSPHIPALDGIDNTPYYTSTTIMDLKTVPDHLIILGAGYIAMEFGQLFRRLGSQVTLLERLPALLNKEDDDIAGELKNILEMEGITIRVGTTVTKASQLANGQIELTLSAGGSSQTIAGSHWLIASGRTPNLQALKPERARILLTEKGFIKTDDRLETSVKGIYALGDVKGGPAFTHISYNDYLVVSRNLLDKAGLSIQGRPVPYCMFTDPELGRIGLTEKAAREKGRRIKVAKLSMGQVARGIETGETRGMMKAIVDEDTHEILGASILAPNGGEIMSVLEVAMMGKLPYEKIRDGIFAHPTFSESLNNLFMTLDNA
jgi:pyruvate/2-oxoglutarate dehydrogenase complex dihydrolipoamide dehydrogenase (E3) component